MTKYQTHTIPKQQKTCEALLTDIPPISDRPPIGFPASSKLTCPPSAAPEWLNPIVETAQKDSSKFQFANVFLFGIVRSIIFGYGKYKEIQGVQAERGPQCSPQKQDEAHEPECPHVGQRTPESWLSEKRKGVQSVECGV